MLVLVFVVYNRRREAQIKYPNPDDDVRENIINYEDEGGGEDDMTAFDITPLQIPVGDAQAQAQHLANMSTLQRAKYQKAYPAGAVQNGQGVVPPQQTPQPQVAPAAATAMASIGPGGEMNVEHFIEEHKRRADLDPSAPPFDDLRNYAYEGGGSTAGSLSSLGSGMQVILKLIRRCSNFYPFQITTSGHSKETSN